MSNVPKGTIDRVMANEHKEYKFETIRLILKALIGDYNNPPCSTPQHIYEFEKEIEKLHAEVDKAKNENLKLIAAQENQIEHLKLMLTESKMLSRFLGGILTLTILVIVIALAVDIANPSLGFFWRA